ncbi:MAG: substrate-binding domain-containing protein [Clostridia bacterium]|nr:substrate-binding domain-containing protein [Clostridia bacterium]
MRLKGFLAIIMASVIVTVALTGCGGKEQGNSGVTLGGEATQDAPDNASKTIAVVAKGESHAFWQAVKAGAEDAAKKYGYSVTFRGPASESSSDLPSQKEMVQTALSNNVSGLVVATIGEGFADMLTQAYDKHIPVVQFDSGIWEADVKTLDSQNKNPIVSTVATSNSNAAALAAERFFEQLKGEIKKYDGTYVVGVIQHDETQTGIDRAEGFINKFTELADADDETKGKYKIEKEVKPGDTNNAYIDALNALVEKRAKAIFMSNEGVVKQVSDAIAANEGKYDNIMFCGFDAGTKQIQWIKSDNTRTKLIGSVAQDSYSIGYNAVEQCVFAIEGKDVKTKVDIAGQWYDSSNVDKMIQENIVYEG